MREHWLPKGDKREGTSGGHTLVDFPSLPAQCPVTCAGGRPGSTSKIQTEGGKEPQVSGGALL